MKFKFEFTLEETNLILAALQELPHKVSNAIILNIQAQAQPQLDKKPDEIPNTDTDTP